MKRRKRVGSKKGQGIFLACILALPILQWLIFFLYVNFDTIMLAFKDARTGEWSLINFVTLWESFTSPYGDIQIAVKNTLKYLAVNLLTAFLCMWVAYFFYKKIAGHKVFQIIFYLPAIISSVAMVTAYKSFITPGGTLDMILSVFGKSIPPEGLLADSETATATIMVYCILTGFTTNVLLFGNAMSRIPVEVLESVALDGCSTVREFFQIIIPMIWSTISSVLTLVFTAILSASGPILLFTSGRFGTTTISYWIFETVYGGGIAGGAANAYNLVSCAGLCFTMLSIPIIMGIRKLVSMVPDVDY